MSNQANNTNNTAKKPAGVELNAAVAAVRTAILELQAKIDAEADPAKKVELIADMKKLTAEVGFVFDDNKGAAEQAAAEMKEAAKQTEKPKDVIMDNNKPSIWTRIKNFTVKKYYKSKIFVVEHKVAVGVTLAAIVAAVAALVISRGRNANAVFVRGVSDAATVDVTIEATSNGQPTVEVNQPTTPSIFSKVGDLAIRSAVGAKDLAVRGAIGVKDLAVTAANKVGGFFTVKPMTPYTVNANVTATPV